MTSTVDGTAAAHIQLLPINRKLRHLRGIFLRNINREPHASQYEGQAIDDETLPHTLRSPNKLLSVVERDGLPISRSCDDFQSPKETRDPEWPDHGQSADSRTDASSRKSSLLSKRPRRKSAVEWAASTSAERQSNLIQAVSRRTADVFFSLHVAGFRDPIYVSEVIEDTTNPDFRCFDLTKCLPHTSPPASVTVKVWYKSAGRWACFLQYDVQFALLQYLGPSLEAIRHSLEENSLIFQLSDGVYVWPSDLTILGSHPADQRRDVEPSSPGMVQSSASYDMLMRLATLDECIQDAIATRQKLTASINAIINDNADGYFGDDHLARSKDEVASLRRTVAQERRTVKALQWKLQKSRVNVQSRKDEFTKGRTARASILEDLEFKTPQLEERRLAHRMVLEDMASQRRRVCSDLADVYPIEPIPNRPLAFTVVNCALPDSTFVDVNENIVSAALGYAAHVVYILSFYLSTPLPYPITPWSSTSSIQDPISSMSGNRIFPLFMPRTVFYRFEYAVFLLNKNIELLASKLGLKLLDIRQTLPNLKYVLFVASAGQGELPARKAGGVRAFLDGRIGGGTPDSSRRSSFDSVRASQARLREQLTGKIKPESKLSRQNRV